MAKKSKTILQNFLLVVTGKTWASNFIIYIKLGNMVRKSGKKPVKIETFT